MKNIKLICATLLLALSLSAPASAGDGHSPGKADPVDGDTASGSVGTSSEAAATSDISGMILADVLLAWLA